MAAPVQPKRHRGNRLGERRGKGDAASSRDASEEDNDNDVSDVGSLASVHASTATSAASTAASSPRMTMHAPNVPGTMGAPLAPVLSPAQKRALHRGRVEELGGEGSQSEGLDSPTYDGDVESSSTIGGTPNHAAHQQHHTHARRPSSPTPGPNAATSTSPSASVSHRLPTPKASKANLVEDVSAGLEYRRPTDVVVQKSESLAEPTKSQTMPLSTRPSAAQLNDGPPKMTQRPVELSEENIKAFVERAIHGRGEEDGVDRWWKTNPPPEGKVVRVYADGVYDLFHFGHGLQLRQAKLSFPKVQLLVGVCSDDLCAGHKSAPSMTHAERCEAVRQCRWVDEVIPDAPWVVDQAFLDKHNIDYIAHDELVYPSKTHEDVYGFAKSQGRFVPTRRTPAISTSDLLERIVRGYRDGFFDSKLEKNGHPELLAADVDWDSSASVERREQRALKKKQGSGGAKLKI